MSTTASHFKQSKGLIAAVDAIWNVKATLLALFSLLAAGLTGALFAASGSSTIAGYGSLLALLVGLIGLNATGIVLMDEAVGLEPRSYGHVLGAGAFALAKLIVIYVFGNLIFLVFLALGAAVFWVCKIPVIGPILFGVAFPLGAVFMGLLFFAYLFVLIPVAAPAIWAGEGIAQAIARVVIVARKKLVNVLLLDIILLLIVGIAGIVVWLMLAFGTLSVGGMAVGILGSGANIGIPHISNPFGGFGGFRATGQQYAISGGIGGAILGVLALLVPMLILLKGFCLVYLQVTEELDFSRAEAQMRHGVENVRHWAEVARKSVEHRNIAGKTGSPVAMVCPACEAAVGPNDAFCGNCGHKLR